MDYEIFFLTGCIILKVVARATSIVSCPSQDGARATELKVKSNLT